MEKEKGETKISNHLSKVLKHVGEKPFTVNDVREACGLKRINDELFDKKIFSKARFDKLHGQD